MEQIKLDRYLQPHFRYYMRKVCTVVYPQFLESYKSVTMEAMATALGVTVDFIEHRCSLLPSFPWPSAYASRGPAWLLAELMGEVENEIGMECLCLFWLRKNCILWHLIILIGSSAIKHASGPALLLPQYSAQAAKEGKKKKITPSQASKRKNQGTTCSLAAEMSSQLIEDHRSGAEVHAGHELCERKSREFMVELGLPDGLLPLPSLDEVGYNRSTGFVWLRQAAGVTHTFASIGKQVWYDKEVTAFVEPGRMHSLTGVKSKELLIWVTISEIVVSPSGTKIVFRTPAGLGRAFPITAFQLEPAAEGGHKEKEEEDAAAAAAN